MKRRHSRSARRQLRTAIIGAGFGGITMAVRLAQAGFTSFTVYERAERPGGVWWWNSYPGAEVDVPSALYSFGFVDHIWRRTYAQREEILAYMEATLDGFGLRSRFRFNTQVDELRWDDGRREYTLTLSDGTTAVFDVVVSAVGIFGKPKIPDWPGVGDFRGTIFHTARWRHDVDLRDKRVAVVGVGSTGVQVAPAIAPMASQLYVYQREPGWILPKTGHVFTDAELCALSSSRLRRRWERLRLLATSEWRHTREPVYVLGSARNSAAEKIALDYISTVFADRPDLAAAVTPKYAFSAKRRVHTGDYFPTLLRQNVELVPHAVERLELDGIVDATGRKREVDVIVAATGFEPSVFLSSLRVYGREGRDLHEIWRNHAFALLGVAIPGFPNFYMLYGPNTNGVPVLPMHDMAARYVIRNLKKMVRDDIQAIDVRPRVVNAYNAWLQRRLQDTAWLHGNNYFRGPDGTIVTQWRDGLLLYWLLTHVLRRLGSTMTAADAVAAERAAEARHRQTAVAEIDDLP